MTDFNDNFAKLKLGKCTYEYHAHIQWNPDNSNLQGKLKKVRVIGVEIKEKRSLVFFSSLFVQYISESNLIIEKSSENGTVNYFRNHNVA